MNKMYNIRPQALKAANPPLRGRRGGGSLWFISLMCLFMTSCGLFDVDEIGVETAMEMQLPQDTFYVMVGDTFAINPVFTPDTVNITDLYFMPVNNDVVAVRGVNKLEAVGEGGTKIYITSVSARIQDSCMVYVGPRWETATRVWPYETVFYAHVTVDGRPLTEDMEVAAFVGNECRAIGRPMASQGISYICLRVGSTILYDETEDDWIGGEDDEYDADDVDDNYLPQINFRCYDHAHRILYTTSTHAFFDGEAHGSLSDLFEIKF